MYWALRNWLKNDATAWGLRVDFVDTSDLDAVRGAVTPGATKLVWIETPANPMWTVTDIAAVAEIAHAAGARLAVDSTVATPVLTQPLALGADIVMHSATKYLNGHSDAIAGALCTSRDDEFWAKIKRVRSMLGQILGPFEAFLLMRGMRTLDLRVRAMSAAAMTVAQHFAADPRVIEVLYAGLPTHAGHEIAARQMTGGFGGMLSVRVRAGEAAAIRTAANVKLWKRATSLGGIADRAPGLDRGAGDAMPDGFAEVVGGDRDGGGFDCGSGTGAGGECGVGVAIPPLPCALHRVLPALRMERPRSRPTAGSW
jgi:cystathionine gamma-synthase